MQVTLILSAVSLAILAVTMYVVVLLIKALRKYIRSEPVRKEKAESARSLGEVLKKRRTACKMTQEFVAETLGVSRQAVSKWESGASDPSTTNLMALAKQYGVTEQLKADNQMEWVRQMNACKAQAEEIVKAELIYA